MKEMSEEIKAITRRQKQKNAKIKRKISHVSFCTTIPLSAEERSFSTKALSFSVSKECSISVKARSFSVSRV